MKTDEDRVRRYGSAIWTASRNDEGTISATGADIVARAVIAVADEEQAAIRAEMWRWLDGAQLLLDKVEAELADARERLRQAEERLAAVGALALVADAYERGIRIDTIPKWLRDRAKNALSR